MDEEKKVMLQEMAMQPGFVRDNIDAMLDAMRKALAEHPKRNIGVGFSIGCGDSYCAAIAARSFMMDATNRMIEPVESLEFSRYLVSYVPTDAFVFGVSNSGAVSRTIEGVRLARERGAWTFAVTVSATNRLAESAETLVKVNATPNIKERPDGTRVVTPGTVTYTASMLGLCVAGIALGERVGSLDAKRSRALVDQFHRIADAMATADETTSSIAAELAASFPPNRKTVIVGGGPNFATAYFGMAKWHEALTRPCHASELEEWAHEEYFTTDEDTDTFILLPPGGGRSRGLEQATAAKEMGSRVIVIAARGDEEARRVADILFVMPPDIPESLTPFVYKAPFEHLSCQIAHEQKIPFLGFHNPKRQQVNFRQIFHSAEAARSGFRE
ncbi:MAG TPA: SIS domain-containing protein [Roseiarcus sp.]|nr:SIS domain-containing protein [Roseiarcus sp.]